MNILVFLCFLSSCVSSVNSRINIDKIKSIYYNEFRKFEEFKLVHLKSIQMKNKRIVVSMAILLVLVSMTGMYFVLEKMKTDIGYIVVAFLCLTGTVALLMYILVSLIVSKNDKKPVKSTRFREC